MRAGWPRRGGGRGSPTGRSRPRGRAGGRGAAARAPPADDGGGLAWARAATGRRRGRGRAAPGGAEMSGAGSAQGERPWAGRRIHLIGVGGAGMSAYARAAYALGAEVSGSDAADGEYLRRLAADGVLQAAVGHRPDNVPAGGQVEVYHSSAVAEDNVERVQARARGLLDRSRAGLLGELSAIRRTIAGGGTPGKTTTAAMIARMQLAAGMGPG